MDNPYRRRHSRNFLASPSLTKGCLWKYCSTVIDEIVLKTFFTPSSLTKPCSKFFSPNRHWRNRAQNFFCPTVIDETVLKNFFALSSLTKPCLKLFSFYRHWRWLDKNKNHFTAFRSSSMFILYGELIEVVLFSIDMKQKLNVSLQITIFYINSWNYFYYHSQRQMNLKK